MLISTNLYDSYNFLNINFVSFKINFIISKNTKHKSIQINLIPENKHILKKLVCHKGSSKFKKQIILTETVKSITDLALLAICLAFNGLRSFVINNLAVWRSRESKAT